MTGSYLRGVLVRDLRGLQREVEAYASEADLWRVEEGISNSGGNLALHLAGNLQCFVGAVLGGSGYERDRVAEFQSKDVPRAEITAQIDRTIEAVEATFDRISEDDLAQIYPWRLAGVRISTQDFLLHLCTHLAYHLGQIDYHRRLVTSRNHAVGTLGIPELASAEPVEEAL